MRSQRPSQITYVQTKVNNGSRSDTFLFRITAESQNKASVEVSRTRLPVTALGAGAVRCSALSPGLFGVSPCLQIIDQVYFVLFPRALGQDSACSRPADSLTC